MLTDLVISNLTVIEHLELSFGAGLNVFTGETGAGKSILLDALLLLMGGKADTSLIREGTSELRVSGQFLQSEPLIIQRIVSKSGRNKQTVNGHLVTLAELKEIAEPLVDFTGQHAQHVLLQPKGQMAMLDAFAGHEALLESVKAHYLACRESQNKLQHLMQSQRDKGLREDWLKFQIAEIERVDVKPGELETLKKEREQLFHATRIREEIAKVLQVLDNSETSNDVISLLQRASQSLNQITRFNIRWQEFALKLDESLATIDDVARSLSKEAHSIEEDPDRLAQVDDRLDELKNLIRKHGDSEEQVVLALKQMRTELASLENFESQRAWLEQEHEKQRALYQNTAGQLSASRHTHAPMFSKAVRNEIADLGLARACFEIALNVSPESLSPNGHDQITILFGANPGEPAHALEKVASGGELSRVLLGIKRVLLTKDLTPVSVFDEVDSGLSGAMAEAIGEKLQKIATGRQVLCITHLAQVAARAHHHFKVEKHISNERTVSRVQSLNYQERIPELARMLGGRTVTELTLNHAKEFLERAQEAHI